MKNTVIDFIQKDNHPIACLFESDLLTARSYWYQHYNADKHFEVISKVIDDATAKQMSETYGEDAYKKMLPSFQYTEFLKLHNLKKSQLEQELTAQNISLKNQMDFYLVEFFKNVNEAHRLHSKMAEIEKSDFIEVASKLSSYVKAAADCFQLWIGSAIIKRGQNMGITHIEKRERARRSKGGSNKTIKFKEAQNLAFELKNKNKSISSIARALVAKHDEDERFKIPGNGGKNIGSLEKTIRRWFLKKTDIK